MENGFQKFKWLFILWLARRLPDCKSMTRSLGESLDRETTWRERLVMKVHLFTCEACARYLHQIEFLKKAVHAHGEHAGDELELSVDSLSAESKARIKASLRNDLGFLF